MADLRRPGAVFAIAALLAFSGSVAVADPAVPSGPVPHIEIVAFGIYSQTERYGRMPAQYRQDAIVDVTQTGMPRLIERTERIDARPCVRFGVEYRAPDLAAGESTVAEVRVEHPALVRPDGQHSAFDSYEVPLRQTIGWTGFDFEDKWEMVPGSWTFSFVYRGRVLASQHFSVLAPPPGAEPAKGCSPTVA